MFALSACPLLTREDAEKQNEDRQLREQVSTIQKTKADSEVRYNDLQNDVRATSGRVDTVEHNQQVANQNHSKEMMELRKVVETQNEKIRLLEQHIDATETRLTAAIQAAAGRGGDNL